jgi:predicted CxxxxCH...CXXCH cytochrome family protein
MFFRQKRCNGSFGLFKGRNAWVEQLTILLSLVAFFLFLDFTAGVQKSTAADCDCNFCHADMHGAGWQGCATCHGNPPATGSHVTHFGIISNYQRYGDTSITKDFASFSPAYGMSCGNCHPLDNTKHRNGTVNVELYNAASPAGSLKAKNLASASYTPGGTVYYDSNGLPYTLGTCSNVYCHSYNAWTTPLTQYTDQTLCQNNGFIWTSGACYGVPMPWPQTQNDPPVPPNTVTTRYYQTPGWGGASLTCSGCHGNPPSTNYYTNDGGSGDSHAWRDSYFVNWGMPSGYEDLHGWNMGFGWAVSCRTCHNDTVTELSTWTYGTLGEWYDVAFYGDVPINNYSKHVNGTADVAFDKVNSLVYRNTLNLADASYDKPTKTCSNVACHRAETSVTWGTPYRFWDSTECNRCHSF